MQVKGDCGFGGWSEELEKWVCVFYNGGFIETVKFSVVIFCLFPPVL